MKQLRYIFFISILLGCSNSLFAQSYKLSDLCATEWNVESGLEGLDELYVLWNFDSKKLNITVRLKEGLEEDDDYEEYDDREDVLCPYDMYLSDTKQESFDRSKIGKRTKGKYIVVHNTYELFGVTYENFNCYEIIKLTPDELVLKEYSDTFVLSAKDSE